MSFLSPQEQRDLSTIVTRVSLLIEEAEVWPDWLVCSAMDVMKMTLEARCTPTEKAKIGQLYQVYAQGLTKLTSGGNPFWDRNAQRETLRRQGAAILLRSFKVPIPPEELGVDKNIGE